MNEALLHSGGPPCKRSTISVRRETDSFIALAELRISQGNSIGGTLNSIANDDIGTDGDFRSKLKDAFLIAAHARMPRFEALAKGLIKPSLTPSSS